MIPLKNKVYTYLSLACLAGYSWVFTAKLMGAGHTGLNVCLIKQLTRLPCPSCGATRSILSSLSGNFSDALILNPIGVLLLPIMVILPFWLVHDFVYQSDSLFTVYQKMEYTVKRKRIAIPSIIIVLANWMWNIYKHL